jgi:chorismate dehydratase
MLEKECDCSMYEFVDGVPSSLNKMLRTGKIDISPSSSIEYLKYMDKYSILEGHSISSKGYIGSITLFSRKPIESMDGLTILTSSQSETSVALLDIILKKSFRVQCNLKSAALTHDSDLSDIEAYLLIGDDALKAVRHYRTKPPKVPFHIYDLGEIWKKYTGLPFIYALWAYKKDCTEEKKELLKKFKNDLNRAKTLALRNLKKLAAESPLINIFDESEIISYWKNISYDLTSEHLKGLELFRKYSEESGLLAKIY